MSGGPLSDTELSGQVDDLEVRVSANIDIYNGKLRLLC